MESHPSHPQKKLKAGCKSESGYKNEHQEGNAPPGMRGGNGSFKVKKGGKSKDSPMQTKTPTSTVTPSTPATLTPASATASLATSRTPLDPATTFSLISSTTVLTTNTPDEHVVGITQSNALTAGTSEQKIKCFREGELKISDKNSSKNIHKTASQMNASSDLQKILQNAPQAAVTTKTALPKSVQQATFSQIPRTTSSPKLRSSPTPVIALHQAETFCKGSTKEMAPSLAQKFKSTDNRVCVMEDSQEAHLMQSLGTKQTKAEMLQRTKDEEKKRNRKEEGILEDIQVGCTVKGSDITLQVASKSSHFFDRPPLSPGATTTFRSPVKETAGKTSENAMAQEIECEREKRRDWKEDMEEKETLEKRGGHEGKDQEKKTEEKIEKERKDQERNSEAKEKETEEREKKLNQIFKRSKDAAVMTEENPVPVQTLDAAQQTELFYEDAEIQAVVEVSDKSTSMSPSRTRPSWNQIDPMINLSNNEKVSGTDSITQSLQNGLSQDANLDSGLAPTTLASVESMAKSLSPTLCKSSSKPTRQHVCQIQIELRSQSTLSDSMALPEKKDSRTSSTRSVLEIEPKQVDREGDKTKTSPLPDVAWDEQGMTWEVYGATVDMESLGFAIQNHLQHKIQEQEQRIRHLRKSISLSEHSDGDKKGARKKKKKRNVFQSLFQRPTCCLKTESEA